LIAVAITSATLFGSAQAAVINWDAPQDIADDSDVSTNGTGLLAYNTADSTSQTVNGVTFGNDGNDATSDYAYTENGITLTSTGLNGAFSPFASYGSPAGVTGDYADLLSWGIYDSASAGGTTITFDGLTPGKNYEVQFWVSDPRNGNNTRTLTLDGAAPTQLNYEQYVIGTFTADSATQTVDIIAASSSDQYNAIQLRDVTVPEPGSMALIGLGGLTLLRRRRG